MMHTKKHIINTFIGLLLPVFLLAQGNPSLNEETAADLAAGKYTVAILDFEGRGISQLESATLTDRLSSELANTNAIILVERGQMSEILDEQGFQQSGCTSDECAAEVGALLGVKNMISGAFGKLGNTYTIDAKMFSVESGATIKTVSKSYKGEIDGLITEIEILAWEILGLTPPEHLLAKQKQPEGPVAVAPAEKGGSSWLLWTTLGLAAAGGGAYYYLSLEPDP
ncbi:MAG: CsgG/HfaB family protein, partial [Candidatus Marinimicrobia bacterium]|nr:CsgG/HfaB family protein [Candidatus Neomarinimicrobiota bacterium]